MSLKWGWQQHADGWCMLFRAWKQCHAIVITRPHRPLGHNADTAIAIPAWCHAEWADAALAYAEKELGLKLEDHSFRVFVLPRNSNCNWGGMGYTGCAGTGDCRAWINGLLWDVSAEAGVWGKGQEVLLQPSRQGAGGTSTAVECGV